MLEPRGHGASDRPSGGQNWTLDHWARLDLPAVLERAAAGGRRPFLVGHSGGGAVALMALAAEPHLRPLVRGVVVIATPVPWLQPWPRHVALMVPVVSRLLGRFPARLLRLGPEDELPGVMIQWMRWHRRGRWIGDDGTDYARRFSELRMPMFFLAGAGDRREARPEAVRALYALVGAEDRHFLVAGTATGFTEDPGHVGVVVSRMARTQIWPRIRSWLQARR